MTNNKYDCLEALANNYFDMCDSLNCGETKKIAKPYSMSGFLYHTNLTKKEFDRLSKTRKFKNILKDASAKIEAYIEEKSLTGELSINASQASLKYFFGWGERDVHTDEHVSKNVRITLDDTAKELAQ